MPSFYTSRPKLCTSYDVCLLRYRFSAPFQLTYAENGKAVELNYVNYAGDKSFSFLSIWFVISFPMTIGTKFELEVYHVYSSLKTLYYGW